MIGKFLQQDEFMPAYDTSGPYSAPVRIAPRLLGLVGERFAASISLIQTHLSDTSDALAAQARAELDTLERLGVQLQQVARMVAHEGMEPQELVDLTAVCHQAVAEWVGRAEAAQVRLLVDGQPLKASVNAAAFDQALDMLIEHGLAIGDSVVLCVLSTGVPSRPTVRVDITRRRIDTFSLATAPAPEDELLPQLAAVLARGCGLLMRQAGMGSLLSLSLTVPPDALEPQDLPGRADLPRTPRPDGGRILIVDPSSRSRVLAHHLLHAAGLRVDAVESVPQARVALRDGEPDVLITGLASSDLELAALVDDIRAVYPPLRVIELVDDADAFAFSMPGADAPGQIGREQLETHLLTAVSQEIYGARVAD
jgi:CheY-like chemotaxis protein